MSTHPNTAQTWPALHGARAFSILLVLACHLLPLGPKTFVDLNIATGQLGISIFFGMSAFLITHKLYTEPSLSGFAINRFFRIVPLLWLMLILDFSWRLLNPSLEDPSLTGMIAHFLMVANNKQEFFFHETKHLWSVCVEAHFYLLAGAVFWFVRRKGLLTLVLIGLCMGTYRALLSDPFNTTTPYRLDELLIPLCIGLIWTNSTGGLDAIKRNLSTLSPWIPLAALFIACLAPPSPVLFPMRPLFAAIFIGTLIYNTDGHASRFFRSSRWRWLSDHSYALYMIHPFLLVTWLGTGDKITMYMKRPLLFVALLALAWLSTRYYEKFFISLGKRLVKRRLAKQLTNQAIPSGTNP